MSTAHPHHSRSRWLRVSCLVFFTFITCAAAYSQCPPNNRSAWSQGRQVAYRIDPN